MDNERAFSQLKLLKTDRRHRLRQDTLNSLLMIRLEGEDVGDFDPNPAIEQWMVRLFSLSVQYSFLQMTRVYL